MSMKLRMCWPLHEFTPDFGDDEVEAMAKLGFNQAVINFDSWAPAAPQLFQMVDSEVWSGMGDPEILEGCSWWLPEQVKRVRKYGIEPYIILFEPLVPFEPIVVYAPQSVRSEYKPFIEDECLGYRYGGTIEDTTEGWDFAINFNMKGRPLCISHPKVRAFYRSRMRELVKMLPDLKGVVVFSGDGRVEFCDSNCPRCRTKEKITGKEYQTRGLITLLNCLNEGAREIRNNFEIILDNGGMIYRCLDILKGVNFPLSLRIRATGVDADIAPSEPAPAFRRIAQHCRENNVKHYAVAELASAEEYGLILGYPDPITTIRKVQSIYAEKVENITTFWGVAPQGQTMNDRILSAVMLNPLQDEKKILKEVTAEVFGESACDAWIRVWHCIRSATEVWNKRQGYHPLRHNFYAGRFRLICWPVTFTLTSPEGVPEYNWQWPICFHRPLREGTLSMMPELLDHLDCAIEFAEKALSVIPKGCKPVRQVYKPHNDWDSYRYGQEALNAIRCVREIVESEMHTYKIANVRDVVEDKTITAEKRRKYALDRLPVIFKEEGETIKRLIPPLKTQMAHLRLPRRPDLKSFRSVGNTEKSPDRWEFIPLLEKKIEDIPAAIERAKIWLEKKLKS